MIKFPCLCGVNFSLPNEMAGGMFQCDQCGRLVTVPTLDELKNLQADGTYDIGIAAKTDVRRGPMRELPADSAIGGPDAGALIELVGDEPAPAPRYDPFTGELVRAMDVNEHVESQAAKGPRRIQPLSTSKFRNAIEPPPPNAWVYVLGQMLMAKNVFVIFIMIALWAITMVFLFLTVGAGVIMLFPIPVVMMFGLLGYYSLVIQETGPGEKDDLPTPLRNFDMRTDAWDPFVHIVLSIVLCFGPAALIMGLMQDTPFSRIVGAAALLAGGFFFPAALLTAAVDGVLANFRPDRMLGVITTAKLHYVPVLIGWGLGTILTMDGLLGLFVGLIGLFMHPGAEVGKPAYVLGGEASWGLLAAGLYFSYYACWQLGLIWRRSHKQFPWVAQVFLKENTPYPPSLGKQNQGNNLLR